MENVEWSAYMKMEGSDIPVIMNPLTWKDGGQLSSLREMVEFFMKNSISEKTKLLIYHSVCGGGKCIYGDALILTNKGTVKIEDIVKGNVSKQRTIEESIDDLPKNCNDQYIGSLVKSLNLKNIKLEDDIISNIFDMGENDTIEITTRSGFNIKCTLRHKLVVIDDNCSIVFKEANDISVGDSIAIANGTDIYGNDVDLSSFYQSDFYRKHKTNVKDINIPTKMDENLAELLGYIISEGNIFESSIKIINDEKIIRDRINNILSGFGISSREIYDNKREKYDGNEINSVVFCDFLRYLGYIDGSKNKDVPWSILQSSKKIQITFLKALFSGDGYISSDDKWNKCDIEYYTTSKKMAEQLHIMLLNIGIFSSLGEKTAICVKEDGEKKDCGICYRISIFGRKDVIKYINTIGFVQDYKKSRCVDMLNDIESKGLSYQSRTVRFSYVRLKNIYEEFKKLGKNGKIIKVWKEEIDLGNKKWKVERYKKLSAKEAIIDRGYKGGNITEWLDGSYSASKRQILKLLKIMKECYYMEDFRYLYNIATSNLEFDTVESIGHGKEHVYDLTIRDNHSYIGNGFINHNSLVLLNMANVIGKTIIVTPFKGLQRQYYNDYFKGNKFVIKKDGTKLKVAVILGRNNFECKWLTEKYDLQQKIIEENKKSGQMMYVDDRILNMYRFNRTASNKYLPCSKALSIVGKSGRRIPRYVVASECPYWVTTPLPKTIIDSWKDRVINEGGDLEDYGDEPEDVNIPGAQKDIQNKGKGSMTRLDVIQEKIKCSTIKYYESVGMGPVGVFVRDEVDKEGKACPPVCPYYEQFYSYVDADVIVMNDAKWQLETKMGRKPRVHVEVMDEGDFWLDSRTSEIEILRSTIDRIIPPDNKIKRMKSDTLSIFDMYFRKLKDSIDKQPSDTKITSTAEYRESFWTMLNFLNEYKKYDEANENLEQKIFDIETILRYIDKASMNYREGKRDETKALKIFIPYPDNILKELFESSSKNIILTSGTIHSRTVLNSLFGINADNYVVEILQGRREHPGRLKCIGPPKNHPLQLVKINYRVWQSDQFREYYYKLLNYILDSLKIVVDKATGRPGVGKILVLTPAKKYAEGIQNRPDVHTDFAKSNSEDDISVKIDTSLSDYVDKTLEDVRKVKEDDINIDGDVLRTNKQIILSTRMTRGADLHDDLCRAVVLLKWPYPDISAGYNQALRKRFGDDIFKKIMSDKAERESVQMVSRGLRHDMDWCYFSTPDDFAYSNIFRLFSYDK